MIEKTSALQRINTLIQNKFIPACKQMITDCFQNTTVEKYYKLYIMSRFKVRGQRFQSLDYPSKAPSRAPRTLISRQLIDAAKRPVEFITFSLNAPVKWHIICFLNDLVLAILGTNDNVTLKH